MKLTFCAACGEREDLRHHDLVSGDDDPAGDPASVITLCFRCHLKLHGRPMPSDEEAA